MHRPETSLERIRSRSKMTVSYAKKLPEPQSVFVVDFFAGCGGMSYGFSHTRQSHMAYEVLAGIDIDVKALETYQANVGSRAIQADVRDIEADLRLLPKLIPEFNPVTNRPLVFIGCAPCQGFSAHRKKDERDDPRNSLLMSFARICKHYRPDFVVMENVPEVLTGKYREYFRAATDELESAGYNLTVDIIDMSLYGVPQRRRRAVLLGALEKSVPLPKPVFTKDTALTVRDAIAHLEPIYAGEQDPSDPCHRAPSHTPAIVERIKKTPVDGGDRRALSAEEQLKCHASVDNGKTPGFTDVYGRLRWDTPSVTITAKSSTPSCGRFLHPEQHRNISVREAAILQGFPQSFDFKGPLVHQYRQIGEAVPPLFARFVAWAILDQLRSKSRIPASFKRLGTAQLTKQPSPKERARPQTVDCFCGAGGLSLGFEEAGFRTAFAFDSDSDCIATFRRNVSPVADRVDITAEGTAIRINEHVDGNPVILVGGPPCQGFSQQRRGRDDDPRNNLVMCYASLAKQIRPRPLAIVLENVTYIDAPRGRRILDAFMTAVSEEGYTLFRHDLNSADFAVPQLRRRVILVALTHSVATHYKGPMQLTPHRWPTIGEALYGLIDTGSESDLFQSSVPNHVESKEGPLNRRRIAYVDMGSGRLAIPPTLQLACHAKYDGHLDVYGRLDWFSQARTITGGFDSFTRGEYSHPFYHRSITAREAARIQGFPDWFVFEGNRAAVRRQIGNAVPPLLAYGIAKGIELALKRALKTLEDGNG
jgi:DNA (cytosine-5)-methyltransferase 1